MDQFFDCSDVLTVDNTAYDYATPDYRLVIPPPDQYLMIGQIAIAGDSNFFSNGRMQIRINGRSVTAKAGSQAEVHVLTFATFESKSQDFLFVEPNHSIEINARVTGGSAQAQFMVTGTLLSRDEFERRRKAYLEGR